MVFFQQKKRSKLSTAARNMATLTDLPIELLFQVLGDLDNLSVLRLRLTCTAMLPGCDTVLQQRLKILYCHPSSKATKHALSICKHPVFSQSIVEVVILGKVVWRDIEKAYPGYSEHGFDVPLPKYRATQIGLSSPTGRFCPWPEKSLRSLVNALDQLPNVARLTYAGKIHSPGWNQVSASTIDAHYHKHSSKNSRVTTEKRFADASVFFALLSASRFHFASFKMDACLPFFEPGRAAFGKEPRPCKRLLSPYCFLTSIDVTLDCGFDYYSPSLEVYFMLLHEVSETLRTLSLTLRPNMCVSRKRLAPDFIVVSTLGELEFTKLETLRIQLQQETNKLSPKRHRPICCAFDLSRFLSRHRDTITALSLDNVTFYHEDIHRPIGALENIDKVIDRLNQSSILKQVDWRISRHRHDPRCKRPETESPTTCKHPWCGHYESGLPDNVGLTATHFADLALEMGVNFEEDLMAWNFGQAVKQINRMKEC